MHEPSINRPGAQRDLVGTNHSESIEMEADNVLRLLDVPDWNGAPSADGWVLVSQSQPLILAQQNGSEAWTSKRSNAWLMPLQEAMARAQKLVADGERVALVRNNPSSWNFLMLVADWALTANFDE